VSHDLLVCDLDGTLIDDSMALEPGLVAAFKRAAARGLHISIATGRMPIAVDRYREELDLRVPLIYYNGALVRDHEGGPDLLSHRLPRGVLARAFEVFADAPVHPIFFRDEQVHCLRVTPPVSSFCDDERLRPRLIPDPEEFLQLGAFAKAVFIGHPTDLALLRAELADVIGPDARLVQTASRYLELLPAAATKGAALCRLAAHLAVPLERVVAVGDQENDLEMIRMAGLGVAMPHAPLAVRAAADRIAPPPEEGGLLHLLAEIMPERFGPDQP